MLVRLVGVGRFDPDVDGSLVADGCCSSDTEFVAVFEREFEPVVRLLFVLCGSNELAQDVAQESFIALYRKWSSVTSPAGFVRTVAINRLRDQMRSELAKARAVRRLGASVGESAPMVDYLADALGGLSVERRAMVVLRFYEQRSVDDIAEILAVRPGTVKSGLSRSLTYLKGVLS